MQNIINYVMQHNPPASTWYHLAAFLLTGAGAQYSVQLVKVISKNKYGKTVLRALNGLFTTLYTAAGAIATGGMSLGNFGKTALALSTVSALIYRVHDSVLYKSAESMVDDGVKYDPAPVNKFGALVKIDPSQQVNSPTATPASAFTAED